ncbi:MAG: phosphotransferase family protein, partial [Desulfobacterales bacterium]|nr:phosphotransferase family protein [Desulfobacterales bacterium]
EEIDSRSVETFLRDAVPDLTGPVEISQFPSGFSNLTYEIRSGSRRMVLRRPPIGAKVDKGHDMEREFRVLSALYPVFPRCPRPLAYCDDSGLIGAPFFVMEKLSGIILRKDLPEGLEFPESRARQLCENLTDTLAEIHAIDMEAAGLASIGKPEGYVRRQVEGWSGRYRKAGTEDAPDCEAVMEWLADKMPADTDSPVMVHNDYKMDNLVLDPGQPDRITGILDWEMATYGDPLMDLGNSLAYWVEAGDPEELQMMRTMPTNLPGALTRQQIIERYGEKTGRDVGEFEYYYCFGLFRLACIAQQIYNRYFHGLTKNKRFAMLIFGVHALEKTAMQIIEQSKL